MSSNKPTSWLNAPNTPSTPPGSQPGRTSLSVIRPPCAHLGERVPGQPCGSPLLRCQKFGDVTTRFTACASAQRCCATCDDYTPSNAGVKAPASGPKSLTSGKVTRPGKPTSSGERRPLQLSLEQLKKFARPAGRKQIDQLIQLRGRKESLAAPGAKSAPLMMAEAVTLGEWLLEYVADDDVWRLSNLDGRTWELAGNEWSCCESNVMIAQGEWPNYTVKPVYDCCPPEPPRYNCVSGSCVEAEGGEYATAEECMAACASTPVTNACGIYPEVMRGRFTSKTGWAATYLPDGPVDFVWDGSAWQYYPPYACDGSPNEETNNF